MVESNLQRSTILPSEKAFAYKMRLEAMNRQGQRNDLTSVPMAQKSEKKTSREKLGELVGESQDQIRRFIRLTELVPEILQMVDERQIAFRPAVEISYLTEEQQYTLLEAMSYNDATPSLAQAIKMKKFMQEGKLTGEVTLKQDYRIFKLTRIMNIEVLSEGFSNKEFPELEIASKPVYKKIVLRFPKEVAYRVYDEFDITQVKIQTNGDLIVSTEMPEDAWLIGYLLTFGTQVDIIEPLYLKEVLAEQARKIYEKNKP